MAEVWQTPAASSTNVVEVYINYLRHKLGDDGKYDGGTGLIETVRGMGYRLGALVTGMRSSAETSRSTASFSFYDS